MAAATPPLPPRREGAAPQQLVSGFSFSSVPHVSYTQSDDEDLQSPRMRPMGRPPGTPTAIDGPLKRTMSACSGMMGGRLKRSSSTRSVFDLAHDRSKEEEAQLDKLEETLSRSIMLRSPNLNPSFRVSTPPTHRDVMNDTLRSQLSHTPSGGLEDDDSDQDQQHAAVAEEAMKVVRQYRELNENFVNLLNTSAELEIENENYRKENEAMNAQLLQMKKELRDVKVEKGMLQAQAHYGQAEDEERVQQLEQQLEELREEFAQRDSEWATSAHEQSAMDVMRRAMRRHQVESLQTKLAETEAALEEERGKAKEMFAGPFVTDLRTQIKDLTTEKLSLTSKAESLEDQVKALQRQGELETEKQNTAMGAKDAQIEMLTTHVDKLKQELEELQEKFKATDAQHREASEEVISLRGQLQKATTNLEIKLVDVKTEAAKEKVALEGAVEKLTAEAEELRRAANAGSVVKEQLSTSERVREGLQNKIGDLETSLAMSEREKHTIREQLQEQAREAELAHTQHERLQGGLGRDLSQVAADLRHARDEMEAMRTQHAASLAEAAELRLKLETLTEERESVRGTLRMAEGDVADMRARLDADARAHRGELERLRAQLEERGGEVRAAAGKIRETKDTEEALRADVRQLKSELDEAQAQAARGREALLQMKASFDETLEQKSEELHAKSTAVHKLREQLVGAEAALGERDLEIELLTGVAKRREGEGEHKMELVALRMEVERAEEARKREASEKDQLRSAHRVQLEELRNKLRHEKQSHADAVSAHIAAAQKWRTTAEEERRERDNNARDMQRDFKARMDAHQQAMQGVRDDLATEQSRCLQLQRRVEEQEKARVAYERELEDKTREEVREQVHEALSGRNTVPFTEHSGALRQLEEAVAALENEKQANAQLKRRLDSNKLMHSDELQRVRDEIEGRMDVTRRDLEREKDLLQQSGTRDEGLLRAERHRTKALEEQMALARAEYHKREEELTAQAGMLRERLAQHERDTARQLEELRGERAAAEGAVHKLQSQLNAVAFGSSSAEREHKHSAAALEAKVETLAAELAAARKEEDLARSQNAELKLCLEAAREEVQRATRVAEENVASLQQQMRIGKQREEKLDMTVAQLTKQCKDAQKQCEAKNETVAEMRRAMSDLKVELAEKARRVKLDGDTLARLQEDLVASESRLVQLQLAAQAAEADAKAAAAQRVKDADAHARDLAALEDRLRRGRGAESLAGDATLLQKNYTDMLHVLKQKEREAAHLQQELGDARIEHDEALREARRSEAALRSDVDTKAAKIEELSDRLAAAGVEISELQAAADTAASFEQHLKDEVRDLRQSRADVDTRLRDATCSSTEAEAQLRNTADAHARQLRALKHEHETELFEAQRKVQALEEEVAGLTQANAGMTERMHRMSTAQHSARTRDANAADALRQEASLLRSELGMKTVELANEADKASNTAAELKSLKRSADQARQANTRLRTELQAATAARDTAEQHAQAAQEEVRHMRESLERERCELEVRQERDAQRATHAEQRLAEATEEGQELRRELRAVRTQLEAAERSAQQLSSEASHRGQSAEQLTDEVRGLRERQRELLLASEKARREKEAIAQERDRAREEEAALRASLRDLEDRHASLRKSVVSSAAAAERQSVENRILGEALEASATHVAHLRRHLPHNSPLRVPPR